MSLEGHHTEGPAGAAAPTVSLTEAARRAGISRRTLGRAIAAGQLRRQPDGRLALADLLALGYELGPGGKSSVLAVRLLEELTAAHARERELLAQQLAAALQAQAAVFHQQQVACQTQLDTLTQQLAALGAPAQPPAGSSPRRGRRVALAGLAGVVLLLL